MAFLDNLKRGSSKEEIKLLRGGREVVFKKVPDKFSLRLKHGTARTADALQSLCGLLDVRVKHMKSLRLARMDVFEVDDRTKLGNSMEILRSSSQVDVVSHVYNLGQNLGSEVIPTGAMTIQFQPDARNSDRERILEEFGLEVIEDLDLLPDSYSVKTTKLSKINPLKIASELLQRKEIEFAESDIAFEVEFLYHTANPSFRLQWYFKNNGDALCSEPGADVKAEDAWDITRGSQEIVVCVIDDDFDLGHPKFDIPGKIVAAKDFSGNAFSLDSNQDFNSHGTACAGLVLAEENGQGIIGLAPKCSFMPIEMPVYLTDNSFVAMFQYAMSQNADIICCCWKARAEFFPLSTAMDAVVKKVATVGRKNMKGCPILFAAGNNHSPLDGVQDGINYLNGFAVHPNVIAVGACNSRNKQSFYSNFGSELAICAPAGGGANARSLTTIDTSNGIGDNFQFNGTSGATSIASGLAALILSAKPELSAAGVKYVMMETADKIDELNGQYIDGHSIIYGHGRINAHKALQRVTQS
jgi:hypothetical protein